MNVDVDTEHLSLEDGPHPDEWVAGHTCAACAEYLTKIRKAKFNKPPGYNLAWLRNSNEVGQTAREMAREIQDEAKRTGKDIRHVGGSEKRRSERAAAQAAAREKGEAVE